MNPLSVRGYLKTKGLIIVCLLAALLLLSSCGAPGTNSASFTKHYFGTIITTGGDEPPFTTHAELTLTREGNTLSGTIVSYFPTKGTTTDYFDDTHQITGTIDDALSIKFREDSLDKTGKPYDTNNWEGRFKSPSEIEAHYSKGDWQNEMRLTETGGGSLSPEERAKNRARAYVEHALTKCGDSYYASIDSLDEHGILQYKNPSFVITNVQPLTQAGQLNKISWTGQVDLKYTASRNYVPGSGWTPWQDYDRSRAFIINVTRKDTYHSWFVVSDNPPRFMLYRKVDCSSVPQ